MIHTNSVEVLAQAIYTVNKHAKTATDNRYLYTLKRLSIAKLLKQHRAKKVGLHFSISPRNSQQQSSVLISCADYYFHTLPEKADFKNLPHLGQLDSTYRNPVRHMGLKQAKSVLANFVADELQQAAPKTQPMKMKDNKKKMHYLHKTSYFYGH